MNYSDKQIEKLLAGIYDGSINEEALPEDLYFAIADYFKKGLYKGFGSTLKNVADTDLELLTNLRENVYMFSAAKTYQETKELTGLLIDEEGNLRSEREFNKVGRSLYDNWNTNYGETEYNTCVLQGGNSIKWQTIEQNRDIYPRVRYSTIGDACAICAPLNGLVFDIDDPELDTIAPENHFNCLCVLEQEDETVPLSENRSEIVDEVEGKMNDNFKNNAGKTGQVFTKDHPYFSEASKEAGKNNFGLPIPEEDE